MAGDLNSLDSIHTLRTVLPVFVHLFSFRDATHCHLQTNQTDYEKSFALFSIFAHTILQCGTPSPSSLNSC